MIKVVPRNIKRGYISNVQETQYTCPNSIQAVITKCTITNISGAGVTIIANIVPGTGGLDASNRIKPSISIAAGAIDSCAELVGQVLNPTDYLTMLAGAASALVISLSVNEVSTT